MARLTTYTCDECGALKQPSNGWWIATLKMVEGVLSIYPMLEGHEYGDVPTFCGRECMQKVVEKHMAKVSDAHS